MPPRAGLEEAYVHLLKLCLTGLVSPEPLGARRARDWSALFPMPVDDAQRAEGRGWAINAYTLTSLARLQNLQDCVEDVLSSDVPGDLIEAGVWRGGASIFMRTLLALRSSDRLVFVADSFEGLPAPDVDRYAADAGRQLHRFGFLSVSLEQVRDNFRRFGVLDDQVRFVKGWFRDSLPALAGHEWSLIRLDGDLYESTIGSLENLYPSLSVGGYLIVDDYGALPPCRQAVDDYRKVHGIEEEIRPVDHTCVYWRRDG
jgi:O-methyltransferase